METKFDKSLELLKKGHQIACEILKTGKHYLMMGSNVFHLGDATLFLQFLKPYEEEYGIKPSLIVDRKLGWVYGLFNEDIDELVELDYEDFLALLVYADSKSTRMHHIFPQVDFTPEHAEKMSRMKYGLIQWHLGLKNDCGFGTAKLRESTRKVGEDLIGRIAIPKKSVIICPVAKSSSMLPVFFWEKLTKILASNGYKIYTNAVQDEEVVDGTEKLSVPPDVFVYLSSYVEKVIGLQSGLTDLLEACSCTNNLTILSFMRNVNDEYFYYLHHEGKTGIMVTDSLRVQDEHLIYDGYKKKWFYAGDKVRFVPIDRGEVLAGADIVWRIVSREKND